MAYRDLDIIPIFSYTRLVGFFLLVILVFFLRDPVRGLFGVI